MSEPLEFRIARLERLMCVEVAVVNVALFVWGAFAPAYVWRGRGAISLASVLGSNIVSDNPATVFGCFLGALILVATVVSTVNFMRRGVGNKAVRLMEFLAVCTSVGVAGMIGVLLLANGRGGSPVWPQQGLLILTIAVVLYDALVFAPPARALWRPPR